MTPFDRSTVAFVLAGGRGERLGELTRVRAKPVLPFGPGARLIDFSLANSLESGIRTAFVLTQYARHELERHVASRWARAGEVASLPPRPGTRYEGTADAVRHNLGQLQDLGADRVLVLAGDHVYRADYRPLLEHHDRSGCPVTIACLTVPLSEATRFGVLEISAEGRVLRFDEKPRFPRSIPGRPDAALVSAGIYVFDVGMLAELLEGRGPVMDFGHHVLPLALAHGIPVSAYCFPESTYWRDVGTVDAYFESHLDLARGRFDAWFAACPSVRALPAPQAGPGSYVAPGARIASSAEIEDCVVLPGASIEAGCRLRRVIVGEGCVVPAHTVLAPADDEVRVIVESAIEEPALPRSSFRRLARAR